jgi:hypothetical protein
MDVRCLVPNSLAGYIYESVLQLKWNVIYLFFKFAVPFLSPDVVALLAIITVNYS